jgi:hypothetical protein
MKDVLKIAIFVLAIVGLVTLIVYLHWLGAIGVAGAVINGGNIEAKNNGRWN